MKSDEAAAIQAMHPAMKTTLTQRITPQAVMQHILPLHKSNQNQASPAQQQFNRSRTGSPKASMSRLPSHIGLRPPSIRDGSTSIAITDQNQNQGESSAEGANNKLSSNTFNLPAGYTPFLDSVDKDIKNSSSAYLTPMRLPSTLTTEDFTRAVAVATVSALRHQGSIIGSGSNSNPGSAQKTQQRSNALPPPPHDPTQMVPSTSVNKTNWQDENDEEGHGGHEAPSWTRGVSAGVLLGCTLLYAIIAGKVNPHWDASDKVEYIS